MLPFRYNGTMENELIRILFVCHGNVCRSPMAEFIMKDLADKAGVGEKLRIESAAVSSEEIWNGRGNPVYGPARRKMEEHGLNCGGKRARQIAREDYERFDLIIAMDRRNREGIRRICGREDKTSLLLDYTGRSRDIPDPWYTDDFDSAWADIEEGCEALLAFLLPRLAE